MISDMYDTNQHQPIFVIERMHEFEERKIN